MRIIATFLLIASLFSVVVAHKSYEAHIERQQQEQAKKNLRDQIRERECGLMFPTREEYYEKCKVEDK